MTKEEIEKKIEELKKKKDELDEKASAADVYQHAVKILLNSAYGATGTKFYPLYDIDIAEATTIGGKTATQEMVRYVNKYLNNLIHSDKDENFIVAGDTDSVSADTYINDKKLTVEELFEKHIKLNPVDRLPNGTEVVRFKNSSEYTYCINGKTKLKNISRHKVSKKCYRISVDDMSVKMTDDHSVIVLRDGKLIECSPKEIRHFDCLLIKSNK